MISCCGNTNAQTWNWANSAGGVNEELGRSIANDIYGNVYVAGNFSSPTVTFGSIILTSVATNNIFIVKYNAAGNVLWAKSAGGAYFDYGDKHICTDAFGGLYITGGFVSTITFGSITLTSVAYNDIFLVKYDSAGNVIWAKSAGGNNSDIGNGVCSDKNGNVFVTGYFKSLSISFGTTAFTNPNTTNTNTFIAKYDGAGNSVWANRDTLANSIGCSISCDTSGNVYTTGVFNRPTITFGSTILPNAGVNTDDIFVVKYDNSGNLLWLRTAGGTGNERSYGIISDDNGNTYITGYCSSSFTFGTSTLTNSGIYRVLVGKFDSFGNAIWAKDAGTSGVDMGRGINIDLNGNIYITGGFQSPTITFDSFTLIKTNSTSADDIFVVKYDPLGNVIWALNEGGNMYDIGWSICVDSFGAVFITGGFSSTTISFGSTTLTNSGNFTNDMFAAKLNYVTGMFENNSETKNISAFPNPTEGIFNLELSTNSTIIIFNVLGQEIFNETFKMGTRKFDMQNQAKGIYFVKIIQDNKEQNIKIIKE